MSILTEVIVCFFEPFCFLERVLVYVSFSVPVFRLTPCMKLRVRKGHEEFEINGSLKWFNVQE